MARKEYDMYTKPLYLNKKQGYLLLDEHIVASSENCVLLPKCPVKDPANPIIVKTQDWEGWGPYLVAGKDIVWFPEEQLYRFYYIAFGMYFYRDGYVESKDCLNWYKPPREQTENHPRFSFDPFAECPADEKYKSFGFSQKDIGNNKRYYYNYVHYSSDGFNISKTEQYDAFTSDINDWYFDSNLNKYVLYYKLWKLTCFEKDDTAPNGMREAEHYAIGFDCTEIDGGWTEIDGTFVVFDGKGGSVSVDKKICIKSNVTAADDGGGGFLSGAWYTKRVVCRAVSTDMVHWTEKSVVLEADELDRPTANIQGLRAFPMGGYYLAYVPIHDERGYIELQLAFSSDGIHWKRPWRHMFIGRGPENKFDGGMVPMAATPVIHDTQMIIYYGALSAKHADDTGFNGIGRVSMRRVGFACQTACEKKTAVLETVALPKKQRELCLNADSEGGEITVALLDEKGNVISGYTHENCIPINEDSASYGDCYIPVRWKGMEPLPDIDLVKVQLRFSNADIYSILI